jgi:hypothetical protein
MTRGAAVVLCAVTVLTMLPAWQARALPRYSARYEQNCMLCHVNPTGGGMRSSYAVQELVPKELAMSPARPEGLALLDTHLNKHITIGADFRNQFMLFSESSATANQQGFFPMQGDVHLAFQLDPKYLLYFKRGVSNTYEFYYLGHVLPWNGYVKGGRFVPPYGWKFDDHTMFTRAYLGFVPPANSDAGVEMGLAPRFGDLQVALVNGSRGSTLDNDRRLAVSGLASVRYRVGPVALTTGVSGYAHPGPNEDFNTAGAFGSVNCGSFTWLGQYDRTRTQPARGVPVGGMVTSHELSWVVRQGVELLATYDFYDPDRELKTGSVGRWGGGLKVMPRTFLVAEALYRTVNAEPGRALPGRDADEGIFQLHFLY